MRYIVIITAVIAVDLITKQYMKKRINNTKTWLFLEFSIVKNQGAAFGLFKNNKKILMISIIMALVFIASVFAIEKNNTVRTGLSFVFGGALGNFIDRIRNGYVTDFIKLRIKRSPFVNIADLSIISGGLICVIHVLTMQ